MCMCVWLCVRVCACVRARLHTRAHLVPKVLQPRFGARKLMLLHDLLRSDAWRRILRHGLRVCVCVCVCVYVCVCVCVGSHCILLTTHTRYRIGNGTNDIIDALRRKSSSSQQHTCHVLVEDLVTVRVRLQVAEWAGFEVFRVCGIYDTRYICPMGVFIS